MGETGSYRSRQIKSHRRTADVGYQALAMLGDPSEADEAVLLAQWAARQPFAAAELGHVLRVDTTRAVDWDHLLPAAHTK